MLQIQKTRKKKKFQASKAAEPQKEEKNTEKAPKSYTISFLLQLKENCTELPPGLSDIPQELVVSSASSSPKKSPSSPHHSLSAGAISLTPLSPQKNAGRSGFLNRAPTVPDSVESFQRNVQSLMNKLSPENFPSVSEKLKVAIASGMDTLSDPDTFLTSVVEVIFEKAVRESRYAESYSLLCVFLSQALPPKGNTSFKKLLLNKCQMEFETTKPTTPTSPSSSLSLSTPTSDMDPEEIRNRTTDRNNGVPQFIGALFLHGLISEKIIHYCLRTLLTTDETDLLKFSSLMTLIGRTIDHPKARVLMDAYFVKIEALGKNKVLSMRIRFKLSDLCELRLNNWQSRKGLQLPTPVMKSDMNKQVNVQEDCEKPGGAVKRALIPGYPNRRALNP